MLVGVVPLVRQSSMVGSAGSTPAVRTQLPTSTSTSTPQTTPNATCSAAASTWGTTPPQKATLMVAQRQQLTICGLLGVRLQVVTARYSLLPVYIIFQMGWQGHRTVYNRMEKLMPAMKVHLLLGFQPSGRVELIQHSHSQGVTAPGIKVNLDKIYRQGQLPLLCQINRVPAAGWIKNVIVASSSRSKTEDLLYPSPLGNESEGLILKAYLKLQQDFIERQQNYVPLKITLLIQELSGQAVVPLVGIDGEPVEITSREEFKDLVEHAINNRQRGNHLLTRIRVEEARDKVRGELNVLQIGHNSYRRDIEEDRDNTVGDVRISKQYSGGSAVSEASNRNKEDQKDGPCEGDRISQLFSTLFQCPVPATANSQKVVQSALCSILSALLSHPLSTSLLLFHLHKEETLWSHPLTPFLQSWTHTVRNCSLSTSLQQQIHKQELTLSRLREKHKSVLSLLGKCINLDWSQLQRRSLLILDCLQGQPRDKYRLSSQKKQQNEDTIEELEREIELKEQEILGIKGQHQQKLEKLNLQREQVREHLSRVMKQMSQLLNPSVKGEENCNLVYGQAKPKPRRRQPSQNRDHVAHSSTLIPGFATRKSVKPKHALLLNQTDNVSPFQDQEQQSQTDVGGKVKKEELIVEISKIMGAVAKQEELLKRAANEKQELLSVSLQQELKGRTWTGADLTRLQTLLVGSRGSSGYREWAQAEAVHLEWLQQRQKIVASPTVTTIRDI